MAFWDLGASSILSGIGSLFNTFSQSDTNRENREAQERINQANLAQARENNAMQAKYAQLNLDQQREFAQQGIRWKVDDAKASGLHPLAALGAQVSSFSPISVGSSSAALESSTSVAPKLDLSDMGQNLSRAEAAGSTAGERTSKLAAEVAKVMGALSLEKAGLENDLLRTNIAKERSQIGPPFPVPLPRPGPDRTTSGFAVKDDDIKQKEEDHPQTKIVRPFGYPLKSAPWFNDGQQFEDRYGESEIGSTIKFGVNTLADHIYTGYGLLPDYETAKNWASGPRRARQQWYRERR